MERSCPSDDEQTSMESVKKSVSDSDPDSLHFRVMDSRKEIVLVTHLHLHLMSTSARIMRVR